MIKFCKKHPHPIMRIVMRKHDTGCTSCTKNTHGRLTHQIAPFVCTAVAIACVEGARGQNDDN